MTKRLGLSTFWLSLLIHLLLILCFIFFIRLQPEEEHKKSPHLYIPSYVYTGGITPSSVSSQQTSVAHATIKAQTTQPSQKVLSKKKDAITFRDIMASTEQVLQDDQRKALHSFSENAEPIFMVGATNDVADPLIVLLGRALSKNFRYPQMAGELGAAGTVVVRLTLHPEGNITDVFIIRSSSSHDLDAAALYAVNAAPLVTEASRFLTKPKTVVIGFIFSQRPWG